MITTYQYVFDPRNRIEETCALAHENHLKAQKKYKKHFDKTARLRTMDVGERVLVIIIIIIILHFYRAISLTVK